MRIWPAGGHHRGVQRPDSDHTVYKEKELVHVILETKDMEKKASILYGDRIDPFYMSRNKDESIHSLISYRER